MREVDLWDLNVCYYVSAVTLLDCNGLLNQKEIKRREKPGWLIQAESKIDAIRKHLSRIDVVLKCKEKKQFTKRQINIERQVRKRFGRTTKENLEESKIKLKQSLKCETEKMRRRKAMEERKKINRKFSTNPKSVYREFRKEDDFQVKTLLSKEDLTKYWEGIWGNEITHNTEAPWLEFCRENYCKDVEPIQCKLDHELIEKLIKKMKNNTSPGRDLVVGHWIKRLTSAHHYSMKSYENLLQQRTELPRWLTLTRTTMLPKNKDTDNPKNFRPKACQNNMFKLYTAIIANFLDNHCQQNNIITLNQAGGKKRHLGIH